LTFFIYFNVHIAFLVFSGSAEADIG